MNTTDTNRRVMGAGVGNAGPRSSGERRKILGAALERRKARVDRQMAAIEAISRPVEAERDLILDELKIPVPADEPYEQMRARYQLREDLDRHWDTLHAFVRKCTACMSMLHRRWKALNQMHLQLLRDERAEWEEAHRRKLLPAPEQDRNVLSPRSDERPGGAMENFFEAVIGRALPSTSGLKSAVPVAETQGEGRRFLVMGSQGLAGVDFVARLEAKRQQLAEFTSEAALRWLGNHMKNFPLSGGAACAESRCPEGVAVFSGTVGDSGRT